MNAWRCQGCHHLFTDAPLQQVEGVLTCPICGEMVCDVTNTRLGREFLEKQARVPAPEQSYLDRKISLIDQEEVQ